MSDLLIENGIVITIDETRRIIKNGAVAIDKDRIVDVGKSEEIRRRHRDAEVIDAEGKLLMPGFVDAHVHLCQTLSRGLADDVSSESWLYERIYPYEAMLKDEEVYLGSFLACIEMLRTGTTTFCDPGGFLMENAARAVEETGIRGIVSFSSQDVQPEGFRIPDNLITDTKRALHTTEELIRNWHGRANGRIKVWCSARADNQASKELLIGLKDLSEKYRVGVQMHTASIREWVEWFRQRTGMGVVEYLSSLDILQNNWLLTHMLWINRKEIKILKEKGVNVCHCPGSSLHGHPGGASSKGKIPEMLEQGVNICVGCDATSANNSLDMIRAMYLVTTIHKEARLRYDLISPELALEMATLKGAKALMMEKEIGSLEPGKKADIILVEWKRPNWIPIHDFSMIPNLVYSAEGLDTDTVIVDGKIIMRNRRFVTIEEERVLERAQRVSEDMVTKLPYKLQPRWPVY